MEGSSRHHLCHIIEIRNKAGSLLEWTILQAQLPLIVSSTRMHPSAGVEEQRVLAAGGGLDHKNSFFLYLVESDPHGRELVIDHAYNAQSSESALAPGVDLSSLGASYGVVAAAADTHDMLPLAGFNRPGPLRY